MNPYVIDLGFMSIRWYSLLILVGVLLGITLFEREGRRFSINKDFLFNLAFWTIIFGILGARCYYVIFNYSLYKGDFLSMFKIWEGGLAIHGGLIAGGITILVYSRKYRVSILRIFDLCVPSLFLAQAIGRWGNFFNGEAHGVATSFEYLQSLHIPDFIIKGMNINGIYYTPTFLYESLACLLGFIIIIIIRRIKYFKVGYVTGFYLIYYSVFRFFIEGLRTDSLMLGTFRVAQIVSVILFISGLIIIAYQSTKGKFESLYNSKYEDNIQF